MKTHAAKWSDRIVIAWAWGLIALLVVHFTATLIYVAPHNGLGLTTLPFVARWIHPFFVQKWTLFAPEPLKAVDYLLVQCRLVTKDGYRDTDLVDISSPLYQHHQRNRLGLTGTILRAQAYPLFVLANKRPEVVEYLLQDHPEFTGAVSTLAKQTKAEEDNVHAEGLVRIARLGSAECEYLHPFQSIVQVRVVWKAQVLPPFSKRHLPLSSAEPNVTDFGWQDYVEVTPWR